jgi:GMP synthase PP-ATPase subunit
LEAIVASVVSSAVGDVTEHILEFIRRAGKITHTELLKKCWREADAQTLALMVRTLIEGGEIEEVVASDNRTRVYKVKGR